MTVGERRVEFPCLYDSGHHLVEPFSGYGVLIMDRTIADELMTVPTQEDMPAEGRWRLIPYDTLHGNGLLPAFMPDEVTVTAGRYAYSLQDCYVAVCDRLGKGEYQGLMGTALGEQLVKRGDK